MDTLMRDSISLLTGMRNIGHRNWFVNQAKGRGLTITGKKHPTEIEARINHGRWIADCPCGGAESVTEDDKVFFCLSCGNEAVNGDFIQVKFPPPGQRKKIELSLAVRKEALRNWFPGETPQKIAKENKKNGLPVPEGAE